VKAQAPFPVAYKGKHVGTYAADLVVEDRLLVEVKCVDAFSNEHVAQCINYLKASGLHLALLCNRSRSFPPIFSEYFPADFPNSSSDSGKEPDGRVYEQDRILARIGTTGIPAGRGTKERIRSARQKRAGGLRV
jgi:hypothetical protein